MTTTLTNGDKTITLFTKKSCVQCVATHRALDAKGIEYDVVDLSEDAAALELSLIHI